MGARSDADSLLPLAPGVRRLLVFGDSFGAGSRLPQEETWSAAIAREAPDLDLVNFGVDGYSLCQALLLSRRVAPLVLHDAILLVYHPREALWRNVNTYRELVGWSTLNVLPRYVLEGNGIELVRSPFRTGADFAAANQRGPSPELLAHLRRYDRLYFDTKYERGPLAGWFTVRLLQRARWVFSERWFYWHLWDETSEAFEVSRRILRLFDEDARSRGTRVALVLAPTLDDVSRYRAGKKPRGPWDAMVAALRRDGRTCIDLMPALAAVPQSELDTGYDSSHWGPSTSRLVGRAARAGIGSTGLLSPGSSAAR